MKLRFGFTAAGREGCIGFAFSGGGSTLLLDLQPNVLWTPARPPKPLDYHPRTLGLILYEIGVSDTQLPLSGACSDSLQRVMVSLL